MTPKSRTPSTHDALSPATLLVGSLSSAASALIVHEFWRAGAILAAGVTPILVAIFSELLRRPMTHVHTRAVTLAGPRPVRVSTAATGEALRVYRAQPRWRLAFVTGLVAFALGASGLTLSELLLNRSVADRTDRTTLFDAASPQSSRDPAPRPAAPSPENPEPRARGRRAHDAGRTAASPSRRGERSSNTTQRDDAGSTRPQPAATTTPTTTPTPAPSEADTVTQPAEQTPPATKTTPAPAAEPSP
jgi:hypothetical protein